MRPSFMSWLTLVVVGCSSGSASEQPPVDGGVDVAVDTTPVDDDAGNDAIDTAPAAFPAFLPDTPQVKSLGGPVIATPKIVPIFFPGDALQSTVTTMLAALPASAYWKEITKPYGIGATTTASAIVLDGESPPATITDDDFKKWIAAKLDGTHAEFGAPDANAIYVVLYPTSTTFSVQGVKSCHGIGAYHSMTTVGTTDVTYAVIGRCTGFALAGQDFVTAGLSHELIEAATDPSDANSAFAAVDDAHVYWEAQPGAEIADMCDFFGGAYVKPSDLGVTVERVWSNERAAAGHHPCIPAPAGEVYFNAIPTLDEKVTMSAGGSVKTMGVKVPVGSSKTIDVRLLSDAPTSGEWSVEATTVIETKPTLKFELDRTTGQNGDTLHLTITALARGSFGGSIFQLTSKLGGAKNVWWGFVAN